MSNIIIECDDCLDYISKIQNDKINLVVTSPPYNVNLGDNKYNKSPYSLYNDNKEHAEYINWLKQIFASIYPKIVSGGRICINVGDGKNGAVPTTSDIIQFMTHEIGYLPVSHIIWSELPSTKVEGFLLK